MKTLGWRTFCRGLIISKIRCKKNALRRKENFMGMESEFHGHGFLMDHTEKLRG